MMTKLTKRFHLQKRIYTSDEGFLKKLALEREFKIHQGCVNSAIWNANGSYLLTGSDDRSLAVTNPFRSKYEFYNIPSGHRSNIFSAKFLPQSDDLKIISAAGDGMITLVDLNMIDRFDSAPTRMFAGHKSTVFDLITNPWESNRFLSCSGDGTVRFYDLRTNGKEVTLLNNRNTDYYGYTSGILHPLQTYRLFVSDREGFVSEYDRRRISDNDPKAHLKFVSRTRPPEINAADRLIRVTSLSFDEYAQRLLASYNGGTLYLFDLSRAVSQEEFILSSKPVAKPTTDAACEPQSNPQDAASANASTPRGDQSQIIFRFRGDWSDTGPEANPDSSQTANDYTSRLSDFMMAAYRLTNHQRRRNRSNEAVDTSNPAVTDSSSDASSASVDEAPATDVVCTDNASLSSEQTSSISLENADSSSSPTTSYKSILPSTSRKSSPEHAGIDQTYSSYPIIQRFSGHRNARTCIQQAGFWGSHHVVSGSDCGHFFVWRISDANIVKVCQADKRVVNRVVPHPSLFYLVTSGIDYDVKLWSPSTSTNACDSQEYIDNLVGRNNSMLSQALNTVTVPGVPTMLHLLRAMNRLNRQSQVTSSAASGDASAP